MAKSTIDMMLDGVTWVAVDPNKQIGTHDDDIPYATHEGVLQIGDLSVHVYQLSNGQRVIDSEDIRALVGGLL